MDFSDIVMCKSGGNKLNEFIISTHTAESTNFQSKLHLRKKKITVSIGVGEKLFDMCGVAGQ